MNLYHHQGSILLLWSLAFVCATLAKRTTQGCEDVLAVDPEFLCDLDPFTDPVSQVQEACKEDICLSSLRGHLDDLNQECGPFDKATESVKRRWYNHELPVQRFMAWCTENEEGEFCPTDQQLETSPEDTEGEDKESSENGEVDNDGEGKQQDRDTQQQQQQPAETTEEWCSDCLVNLLVAERRLTDLSEKMKEPPLIDQLYGPLPQMLQYQDVNCPDKVKDATQTINKAAASRLFNRPVLWVVVGLMVPAISYIDVIGTL